MRQGTFEHDVARKEVAGNWQEEERGGEGEEFGYDVAVMSPWRSISEWVVTTCVRLGLLGCSRT